MMFKLENSPVHTPLPSFEGGEERVLSLVFCLGLGLRLHLNSFPSLSLQSATCVSVALSSYLECCLSLYNPLLFIRVYCLIIWDILHQKWCIFKTFLFHIAINRGLHLVLTRNGQNIAISRNTRCDILQSEHNRPTLLKIGIQHRWTEAETKRRIRLSAKAALTFGSKLYRLTFPDK